VTAETDLETLVARRPELVATIDRLQRADGECWHPDETGADPDAVAALLDGGVIEETDDGYRFTDPAAVRTVLDRHREGVTHAERRSVSVRAALVAALVVVVLVRLPPVFDVFRGDWIVLVSNDPYFYRYLVEASLSQGPVPSLPAAALHGEPLLVATLATAAALLGGSVWASGFVLAWYPVVAAVITGGLVYATATELSGDARVGLAATGLLAVTPAHAYRTSLGVADHHAFDYVWLALTAFALVTLLSRSERDRRTWRFSGVLAVAVAGQTLSWEAAPLLLVPLAVSLGLVALLEVRRPGPERLTPVVAGLMGGGALAHATHLLLGWQSPAVIYALDLLALGSLALLGITLAVRRTRGSWIHLAGMEATLAVVAVVAIPQLTVLSTELDRGIAFFSSTQAAELAGVGSNYGAVGVLVLLGFAPVLAGPTVVWAVKWGWQRLDPGWFVLGVYVLHFGVLAALQRRFGGELAPFAAVLGGVGFVALVAWFDLVTPPAPRCLDDESTPATDGGDGEGETDLFVPDRTRLALLGGFAGVVVGSGSLYTALIDRRLVIDDATHEAARWIADYVEANDLPYPESYVLAKWGRARVYNYFVNGEAASYQYAERTYEDFLFSTDADGWYAEFEGRVGFVVTRDLPHLGVVASRTVQSCLHKRLGSAASESVDGAGHFRLRHVTEAGDGARKVFQVVPGATIRGPSATATATTVRLVADVSTTRVDFQYVRYAAVSDGRFEVTVAHPGTYRIGETGAVVEVTERAVERGATLTVDP
jgi:dolichyl-diphosphooligosaccharide--protein glycosyltransferase